MTDKKYKIVHKVIDLAADAYRKRKEPSFHKLLATLDEMEGESFETLCSVYDFGVSRGVSSTISIMEKHKEQQKNIYLLKTDKAKSFMRSKMRQDELLEVNLVRGLGLISKAGIADTGAKMS